jgi:hypothetical protein
VQNKVGNFGHDTSEKNAKVMKEELFYQPLCFA